MIAGITSSSIILIASASAGRITRLLISIPACVRIAPMLLRCV
jgi:hypothetical protein